MVAQFREMFLNAGVRGRPGRKIIPKAVVIHWTANTHAGADAVANRNYFNNSGVAVSAHYIVDDHQVVQCLPENEMAYHVGAKQYTQKALAELSSYPNNCTIGIEMCVNSDGNFSKTYQNTVELTAGILRRYGWGVGNLWRHYDVTGKDCPRFFVRDDAARAFGFESAAAGWEKFKKDVEAVLMAAFRDIATHWAKEDIEYLYKLGVVRGDGSGDFHPDEKITRAEVAVLLNRVLKLLGRWHGC